MRPLMNRQAFLSTLVALATVLVMAQPSRADFASTRPTQRVDYWQQRLIDITSRLDDARSLSNVKLVFIGDSITDFWLLDANPWMKGKWCGRKVWDESFGERSPQNLAINLGISGDRLEHVLYRLEPKASGGLGELERSDLNPEFLVIMLGINNTWDAEEPTEDSIFEGIKAVIAMAHAGKPHARIILQSLLPTLDEEKNRSVVRPVNARLAKLAADADHSGYIAYLDLYSSFVDADGKQVAALFNDGLHPSQDGYRVWRDRLVPFLKTARESGGR